MMRVGYPCINTLAGCTTNRTFRLNSYSEERFIETVRSNLECLMKIMQWNLAHEIYFFRIGSQIVPFASHAVCTVKWWEVFKDELQEIGKMVKKHGMRVAMHPDQFVLLNAVDERIVEASVQELRYQARFLEAMGLGADAKLQIHVGGMYGDKKAAMQRFVHVYQNLGDEIKKRLVIENDDRLFSVKDCMTLAEKTGVPILVDVFHHDCLGSGESVMEVLKAGEQTWKKEDGRQIVDFSQQEKGARLGKHGTHVDMEVFARFYEQGKEIELDVMLEIKDKEVSALEVRTFLKVKDH